jgi:hypothetical protein
VEYQPDTVAARSFSLSENTMVAHESDRSRWEAHLDELTQTLLKERARSDQLARALANEQIYAENLGRQLRTVCNSRLWRAAQWVRRVAGRGRYVPDLERPIPGGGVLHPNEMVEVFRGIYSTNAWGSEVSHSGAGSDLEQTAVIRSALPALLREFGIRSMLDVPCGDFHWMREVELDADYTGGDVVPDLVAANETRYGNARRRFKVLDIANDTLLTVDLVFCRDLLVHFSFDDALRAIANLRYSGSTYLLTTTFTDRTDNPDIETGQWRPINLQLPPFNFPPPLRMINENCTEGGTDWADKSLGLWRLGDL